MVRTHPQSKALKASSRREARRREDAATQVLEARSARRVNVKKASGRGDTVRLRMSGILRGVGSAAGKECTAWQQDGQTRNATNPTIGSGMQQARDSQDPRGSAALHKSERRSKPTRWCETTRLEQDFWHGMPEAEGAMATSHREWTPERLSMKGR